jgi:hypothetical protein
MDTYRETLPSRYLAETLGEEFGLRKRRARKCVLIPNGEILSRLALLGKDRQRAAATTTDERDAALSTQGNDRRP